MSEGKMSAEELEDALRHVGVWCALGIDTQLASHISTLQREADGMREALRGISEHAENQDINHLDFRIHAKRCADQALEARSPQDDGDKGSDL